MASALSDARVISFDLETTGLNPLDSRILLLQIGIPFKQFILSPKADVERIFPFLTSRSVEVIIHNAKFEQKFMQYCYGVHINSVFDTMLAEQVLYSEKYARSLEYITKKYLGRDLNKKVRESFFDMKPISMFTTEQLNYAAEDVEVLFGIYEQQVEALVDKDLFNIAQIEFDAVGVVAAMELEGIPLNTALWRDKVQTYKVREKEVRENLFSLILDNSPLPEQTGMFERDGVVPSKTKSKKVVSVIDSPDQVGKALTALGIELPTTEKGNLATDERTLSKIDHPAAKLLLEYRSIEKVIDSYGESFLSKIHPFTGRIHPDFQQLGAETGRFSCRVPNVQQIPEEFREFIGYVDDYKIVGADYSQMELRIIAELSQDPALIKAFSTGDDPHASTAAIMFNIPIETVTKEQRHVAKTINFGLSYGMQADKLRDTINAEREKKLTINEVYKLDKQYRETYRGVIRWFEEAGSLAYHRGYSLTLGGRKRFFNRPSMVDSETLSKQIAAIRRQGGNAPIQGSNADITKLAMINLYSDLQQYGFRAKIINVVHDEIVLLAHKRHAEAVKEVVAESMLRSAQQYIKSVPVKVDAYVSDIWKK